MARRGRRGGGGPFGGASSDAGTGSDGGSAPRGRSTDGCMLAPPDDLAGLGLGLGTGIGGLGRGGIRGSGRDSSSGGADLVLGMSAPASSPKWHPTQFMNRQPSMSATAPLPLLGGSSPPLGMPQVSVMPVIGFHPPAIACSAAAAAALFSSSSPSSPMASGGGQTPFTSAGLPGAASPKGRLRGPSVAALVGQSGFESNAARMPASTSSYPAGSQSSTTVNSGLSLSSAPALSTAPQATIRDDSLSSFMKQQSHT